MANVTTSDIRNITIAGLGHSGKTTLTESMLYVSGAIPRFGKVDEGHSTTDFDSQEIKRKISINDSIAPVSWKNKKLNIIDSPGYADFIGEVISALAATDCLLMVVDAVSGVQVQTTKIWAMAEKTKMPRAIFINKLDKEHSDFAKTLSEVEALEGNMTTIFLPIGKEASFKGIVDIASGKAYEFNDKTAKEIEVPAELQDEVSSRREKLIEAAAEGDDTLLEKYLDVGELTAEEVSKGLVEGIKSGGTVPVFCGSGLNNTGTSVLLDSLVSMLPSPDEMPKMTDSEEKSVDGFSGLVFKTMADPYVGKLSFVRIFSGTLKADLHIIDSKKDTKVKVSHIFYNKGKEHTESPEAVAGDIVSLPKLEHVATGDTLCSESSKIIYDHLKLPEPVLTFAIEPKTKGDDEKISAALTKLSEEDSTISVRRDSATHETIVSGLGDMQLDVLLDRMKEKFNVEAIMKDPKIPYRETIMGRSEAQGKYKKQTGGRGQYGDVWLRLEPLPKGSQFEFVNAIKGGVVPQGYIPAVQKGVADSMNNGVIAGYPVVDIKVTLYDGSFHPVDSSEMAFKIASSMGFKNAFLDAKPVLLEPFVNIEAIVPDEYMGDVIGDLSSKRGKVEGMDSAGKNKLVKAKAPLAEVSKYAIELRALTHGEGSFSMSFSHYEEVPPDQQRKIVEQAQKQKEEEHQH